MTAGRTRLSMVRKVFDVLDSDQRRTAGWLFLLMLLGMAFETLGVGLVVPAMALMTQDDLAASHPISAWVIERLGHPSQPMLVLIAVCALAAVYLVKNLFLAFLAWRQAAFAFAVQARISHKLFTRYLRAPYVFHIQNNSAQLIRNVTTEAAFFCSHALLPGLLLTTEAIVLIGISGLLLYLEPIGALIVGFITGVPSVIFLRFSRHRVAGWGKDRQVHDAKRLQLIQEGLAGIKDVLVLGRGPVFLARFDLHNEVIARVGGRQLALQQMPRMWIEFVGVLGVAALIAVQVLQDRSLAQIAAAVGLFATAAFRLMPSVSRVITALNGLRYGRVVLDLVHTELGRSTVEATPKVGKRAVPPPFSGSVALRAVTYSYPEATRPALQSVSIDIRYGETLGIVGSSGSGKSTVVDVLLGLLPPDRGTVEVDGRDIHADIVAWRSLVGYVPQAIYLTDDSLRRNVAFGVPDEDIDEAAVLRALSFAQLDEFVAMQPAGLDTFVGERGVRLSGGQRQRIGIARALYHDPPILVLDEATSALDVATEAEVMKSVAALHGRKTIVIVAHRLSTVEQCDRLCRLESGQVVQSGRPAEVLDQLVRTADASVPSME
ncbi:MAG: ABC transporter ATP-binding protein/permease [Methyloversatilis sp.]|uniref:ABC transporter ATP-binding protein n=1 Tax=Methyloversatilis sp. TaxID=2569862 RepID=UPI0025F24DDC|nr:ABC transporter ATP-binding protein [Methyloversatilis sp.]MCR6664770.1 ABC transporter ATP-binding protein/permease [Methyloversatilis sp.]